MAAGMSPDSHIYVTAFEAVAERFVESPKQIVSLDAEAETKILAAQSGSRQSARLSPSSSKPLSHISGQNAGAKFAPGITVQVELLGVCQYN